MPFLNMIHTLGTTLGVIPKGTPTAEELDRLYRAQMFNMRAGFLAVGFGCLSLAAETYIAGFSIDRLIQIVLLLVVFGLLQAIRSQIAATHVWRVTATSVQISFNSMHDAFMRLSARYASEQRLQEAIFQIPDGWMSSYGVMNVSRHNAPNRTGPTCFLWSPDAVIKDGKVESRAVTGYGDTIPEAIIEAVEKARAVYEPTPA